MIRGFFLCLLLTTGVGAQEWAAPFVFSMSENSQATNSQATDPNYEQGLNNLDARRWVAAAANFETAARNKSFTDAALYWKAYALSHAGRTAESLEVLRKLQKAFPDSPWLKDARALSLQVRSDAGHPVNPAAEPDTDLKLLALNTLMQDDPPAALPALLRVIHGTMSSKTREHALFVLAQSDAPEARQSLMDLARQPAEPAVQISAVRMMGMMGGKGARAELEGLYNTSSDQALKHEILNGLMLSGSKSTLLTVAKTEPDQSLRDSAIRNLSLTGGKVELSELYKSAAAPGEKRQILSTFALTGDAGTLVNMLKQENDPALRADAIRSLGMLNGQGGTLTALYLKGNDNQAVLDALVEQQDAAALFGLARKELDSRKRSEIMRRLEAVKTPESRRYLRELAR